MNSSQCLNSGKMSISKENIENLEQEMFLIVYNSVAGPDKNPAI